MRLLFEGPNAAPQYCAAYEWLRLPEAEGGIGHRLLFIWGGRDILSCQ
jgi:hypothetical protein